MYTTAGVILVLFITLIVFIINVRFRVTPGTSFDCNTLLLLLLLGLLPLGGSVVGLQRLIDYNRLIDY